MARPLSLLLAGSGFGIGVLLGVAWGLIWPRGPVTGAPPSKRKRSRQPSGGAATERSAA
ncbi:MAG TPA: hypothetical protein VFA45_17075 [Actinomycetes bacterium]|nr:hypothetical protein [Actinomycetes bacterium]